MREHELPPIRLHDLRHGTATQALTAGIDIKLVQDLLGHTTSSFTRGTRTSVADEARRIAPDTLAAFFSRRETAPPRNADPDTPHAV